MDNLREGVRGGDITYVNSSFVFYSSGLPAAFVVAFCREFLKIFLNIVICKCSLLLVFTGRTHGPFHCL